MKVFSFSNGENKKFPSNSASDFTISLPEEVETRGCEVGLLELGFRVEERSYSIHASRDMPILGFSETGVARFYNSVLMLPGFYSSEKHILEVLQRQLKIFFKLAPIAYGGGVYCQFPYPRNKDLALPIYTPNKRYDPPRDAWVPKRRVLEAKGVGNVIGDYLALQISAVKQPEKPSFMFFYCDIIQPHLTGDTRTQSMRTIPIQKQKGLQHTSFEKPFFFPSARDAVKQIRVVLKDEYGKDVDVVSDSLYASIGVRPVAI